MSSDDLPTRLMHVGTPGFDPATGIAPVNMPVVRTSTVRFASSTAYHDVMQRNIQGERIPTYGRQGMDTHHALQDAVSLLEGGERTLLAPSGVAAINFVLLALLSPGDHAVITDNVYGPVRLISNTLLQRMGIHVTFVTCDTEAVAAAIRPETRLIYTEAPGSLLYEMVDLPALAELAQARGIVLASDNTWGAGYFYRPLALGADISVQAATKYLGGHSDVMMGTVTFRDAALAARLRSTYYALGLTVGADDASLVLRGVRTLPVRLQAHHEHALAVARFLSTHPAVAQVYCPGLPGDPGHALWQRDCTGQNGLVSFALAQATPAQADAVIDALQWFGIGFSWGGYESLAQRIEPDYLSVHSAWTHGAAPLIRLHVGLENPADLIADLTQALARLP